MKIEYIKGNLFDTEHSVIIHGCNAQGRMGSGVAKIVIDDYNEAYQAYRNHYELQGLSTGEVVWGPSKGKIFGNAITQEFYGPGDKKYVSYDAVYQCMMLINIYCRARYYTHVAMPKIGAGLAGGDWEVIAQIISSELRDVQPVVYVI